MSRHRRHVLAGMGQVRSWEGAAWIQPVLAAGSLVALLLASGARAGEVSATQGPLDLGTRVNGMAGGRCQAGHCQVSGGTAAGANLFHRFNRFDTRGEISGVSIQNGLHRTVVLGVLDPLGSFLNKGISLSSPAHLFFLSPGGLHVGAGAQFFNTPQLTLSTASTLGLGSGRFDVFRTTAAEAALLTGMPIRGRAGLSRDPAEAQRNGITNAGDLVVDGGLIQVDAALLLDAQGGHLLLQAGSQLAVPGGSVELNGNNVTVAAGALVTTSAQAPAAPVQVPGPTTAPAQATVATTTTANPQPLVAPAAAATIASMAATPVLTAVAANLASATPQTPALQVPAAVAAPLPETHPPAPAQIPAGLDEGVIRINATRDAVVAGQLKALGVGASASGTAASGGSGKGGRIEITGQRVALKGAALDASGPVGGGTVLLGGDIQGANPGVPNATTTTVDGATTVRADALAKGGGGTVVAYGSKRAAVDGLLSARGGPDGGNGGFVETSGATLALTQAPDASAPKGKGGTWLIDPNNLTVNASGPDSNVSGFPNATTTGDGAVIAATTINTALDGGTSVSLTTSAGGSQAGDITVAAPISKTAGGNASLSLNAHNNIFLNSDITSTSAALNLNLNADLDGNGSGATSLASGASLSLNGGTATANGPISMAANSKIKDAHIVAPIINSGGGIMDAVVLANSANPLTFNGTAYIDNGLRLASGATVTSTGTWILRGDWEQNFSIQPPQVSPTVWWDVIGRDLRFDQAQFTSVGSGSFNGNTASVNPGSSLSLSFNWAFGGASSNYNYCPNCVIQNYVAWVQPSQALNSSDGFVSGRFSSDSSSRSGTFNWTTSAPSTPGIYYIGSGSTLDYNYINNVPGRLGGPASNGPYGNASPFKVSVLGGSGPTDLPATLNLVGGTIKTDAGAIGQSLVLNTGIDLGLDHTSSLNLDGLKLNAASLHANGTVTAKALDLLAGSISGSGDLQVTQIFNRSGGTIDGNFSNLSITQTSGSLTPGALSAAGPVTLRAQNGQLNLNAPITASTVQARGSSGISLSGGATLTTSASSGTAITLDAGSGTFLNTAGPGALAVQPSSTWAIYADNPTSTPSSNLGGLPLELKQYNTGSNPILGYNGLYYAYSPKLSVNLVPATPQVSKVYNGTVAANLVESNYNLTGVVAGDSVIINKPATGVYDNKNVGTGKLVSVSGLSITSAFDSGYSYSIYGYSLQSPEASGAIGSITPASLTISATTDSRVYNGNTNSSGTPAVTSGQVFSGDTLSGLSQVFGSKNVLGANQSTLSVNSGYTLSDGNSGINYAVSLADVTGTINQLALSGAAIVPGSSIYGSALAPGVVSFGNIVGSDAVGSSASVNASTLSSSGQPIVGTYSQSASGLTGTDAGNYSFSGFTSTPNYTISKLALTGAGIGSGSSIYGSALAPGVVSFGNIVGSDAVGSSASVNTSTLSTSGKPIVGNYSQSASGLTGTDAGNYSFSGFTSTENYSISRAMLTPSFTLNDKPFDANSIATIAGYNLQGVLTGDDVSIANASATFDNASVANNKPVTIDGFTLSGPEVNNYQLSSSIATATASITSRDNVNVTPNEEPIDNNHGNPGVGNQSGEISSRLNPQSVEIDSSNISPSASVAAESTATSSGPDPSQPTPSASAVSADSAAQSFQAGEAMSAVRLQQLMQSAADLIRRYPGRMLNP